MKTNLQPTQFNEKERSFLSSLNAIRLFIVIIMAFGFSSTMPLGPDHPEMLNLLGYDPSWIGLQVLFFVSGILALRSVSSGRTGINYLSSRFMRNIPLLFSLTIATLIILFPLFGTPLDQGGDFYQRVIKYILLTTFCISPGEPIQGLMDDALYVCIVQGGIWTLRYGAILHIVTAFTGRLGWLNNRVFLLLITVMTMVAYICLDIASTKTNLPTPPYIITGLHFAYAFLLGMSAWAYRDYLLTLGQKFWLAPILIFGFAFLNYKYAPWSPLIDVGLSVSFMGLVWVLLWSDGWLSKIIRNCPNLTLPSLMISWPTAQTLLLLAPQLTPWQLIALTLPLTLILSQMVWYLTSDLSQVLPRMTTKEAKTS